jgi:hypothetical protein
MVLLSAKKVANGVKLPPVDLAESVGKPGTMLIVAEAPPTTNGSGLTE